MPGDVVIERKTYAQGDTVFKQGSTGRTAFIVQKGAVDILHQTPEGEEKLLGNIGQGGIFGEMALIDDHPRMATARCTEPTTVIVVTEQMFLHKLDNADPFIRGLMHIMADTIRSMSDNK